MNNEIMNIAEKDSMKSKVYVKLDNQNRIIQCEGGYAMSNITNIDEWTYLDSGYGDKYNLCQSHYFESGIYTDDGFPKYKYVNGSIVERSEDELSVDRASMPAPTPTQLDRIEAQVMYTALMTDSLLEEDK